MISTRAKAKADPSFVMNIFARQMMDVVEYVEWLEQNNLDLAALLREQACEPPAAVIVVSDDETWEDGKPADSLPLFP